MPSVLVSIKPVGESAIDIDARHARKCSNTATPYCRLQHRRDTFDQVATLSVEGLNLCGWRIPNYSSGDSGPPIFPLEIDEHDQLAAKDTKRERSVTEALYETSNTLILRQDS